MPKANEKRFKTGTVARRLRIAPALLRAWESRHGIVEPERGPGGQRLYTEADVRVISAVQSLLASGYSIGELAAWSRRSLLEGARSLPAASPSSLLAAAPGGDHQDAALFVLDREGRIVIVTPNVESVLGWSSDLLVGQPIWGLLIDFGIAMERFLSKPLDRPATRRFWVWMRSSSGAPVPCRLECGRSRDVAEGTATTISVRRLAAKGAERLTAAFANVARATAMSPDGDIAVFLERLSARSVDVQRSAFTRVWIHERASRCLRLVASVGLSRSLSNSSRSRIQLASYPYKVGVVARSGVPYVHNGLEADSSFDRAWVARERLESAAVFPLVDRGNLLGVMAHFFRRPLSATDVGELQATNGVCQAALANAPPLRGEA